MLIDKNSDESVQKHTEAYYEELASQEEIYLEESEERARVVLISENPSPSDRESQEIKRSMTDADNICRTAGTLVEELGHAAEELITGDSDDPPLSEESEESDMEMLKVSLNVRKPGSS